MIGNLSAKVMQFLNQPNFFQLPFESHAAAITTVFCVASLKCSALPTCYTFRGRIVHTCSE